MDTRFPKRRTWEELDDLRCTRCGIRRIDTCECLRRKKAQSTKKKKLSPKKIKQLMQILRSVR